MKSQSSSVLSKMRTAGALHILSLLVVHCTSATDISQCDTSNEDGNALMQTQRFHPVNPPYKPMPIAGKSIYFILTDRFARSDGNDTECGFTDGFQDNNWCNGTIKGVINQLDYIQGMGFEGIWITPIVEQIDGMDGQSGYGSHGYWAKNIYEVDQHYGTKADVILLSDELHKRGMVFILDIVANHMGPIHSAAEAAEFYPFDKPEYYHQLNIGDMTFDEYTKKNKDWPPPTQCQGPGALCAADSRPDCGCYAPACGGGFQPPCTPGTLAFNESSGCPTNSVDSVCRPGAFACRGYNETVIHEGWFFDLGDLNQSHPFVWKEQLKWVKWLKDTYKLDAFRLDTAPYMPFDFLSALHKAAEVPILGETTATNLTFHAEFQTSLGGVLNFPLTWVADSAFCGNWFPDSYLNLSTLASRTTEQLYGGFYEDLDLLGNFMDNHDMDRLAVLCTKQETSRMYNSLAWSFFAKGMPIYYYGTEVFMTEQRGSFWQTGFKTSEPGYQFVKRLNLIRKRTDMALEDQAVVAAAGAEQGQLMLRRGGVKGTYAFLNNRAMTEAGPIEYCMWSFPAADQGQIWVDGISGIPASIDNGCYKAPDSLPKIVLQMRECVTKLMDHQKFYYDVVCLHEKDAPGCKADGKNQACRYCGKAPYPDCPKVPH